MSTETTTTKTEDLLAEIAIAAERVDDADRDLVTAKEQRDSLIRRAQDLGVGSRTIAAVSGLSHTGVRKITLHGE